MDASKNKRPSDRESETLSKIELLKTSWKYQAKEFFNNSNLHGVHYIAEKDRPFHEKFIWFSFIVIGLLVTLVIISSLWEKFQTSPTITGLDTDFHKWDMPFPAVTLCPQNPADPQLVRDYISNRWGNVTEDRFEFYQTYLTRIANISYDTLDTMKEYSGEVDLYKDDLRDILTNVVIPCQDLITDCEWKSDPYECCSVFYPVLTDHGFCYTFNSKHYEDDFSGSNITSKEDFRIKYIYETDNDLSLKFDVEDVKDNPVSLRPSTP
ncbi:pickpocket protein 28-like [Planococcus citri]|uniref:pickpocket protein 28-like n=1 Tax=Planococcus citri TaxID=170843 RepID=UPI0031F85454